MTNPTKWPVRPAKTQISLGIHLVWSESSLCAQWVAKDPSFLHADSEDSEQTGQMPRLIWLSAGRTGCFVGFVMRRLMFYTIFQNQTEKNKLNDYHKAMFLWNFQRGLEGFRFDLGDQNLMTNTSSPTQLVQKWEFLHFKPLREWIQHCNFNKELNKGFFMASVCSWKSLLG